MNRTIINKISKNFIPITHYAHTNLIINKNMIEYIEINESVINKTFIVDISYSQISKKFRFNTKDEANNFVNDILKE